VGQEEIRQGDLLDSDVQRWGRRALGGHIRTQGDALIAAEETERRARLGEFVPRRANVPSIETFAHHYLATAGTHGVSVGRRKNVEGHLG
jgi:hypothetical protein